MRPEREPLKLKPTGLSREHYLQLVRQLAAALLERTAKWYDIVTNLLCLTQQRERKHPSAAIKYGDAISSCNNMLRQRQNGGAREQRCARLACKIPRVRLPPGSKSQPRHYCFAFELGPAERFFALVFLPLLIQLMFISAHVISFQPQAMLGREVTTKRITKRIRMCSRTEKTRPEESVQINTVLVKVVIPFRLLRLSRLTWVCRHWTGERK